jgi:prephenate dehydratase
MCLPGQQIEDIRSVHSHPMALLQCQQFLQRYPHIKLVEADDTAGAAEVLKPGQAAIASRRASELNQLQLLASGIEDNPENFTRFLILKPEKSSAANIKADKASLCFNLNHSVGSLAQVLLVFSAHGLNLTKIQSLPVPGQSWEYFFHIDLEFQSLEQYRRACAAIGHLVHELHELGVYKRFTMND